MSTRSEFTKSLLAAVALAALAVGIALLGSGPTAQGQVIGDAAKGKQAWESAPLNFVCQRCHGRNGQGARGPDLAGRSLTVAQWIRQIRQPYGLMPAFPPTTINDETIADVAAYMASLPTVDSPGAPLVVSSLEDSIGKRLAIEKGCAQCHGVEMSVPRAGIGENGLTREDILAQIRTAFYAPKFNNRNATMPTFVERQVSDDDAARIQDYLFKELGPRVRLDASIRARREGNVVTYTITVTTRSTSGGMDASQIFVAGSVPQGATSVRASATPANSFFRGFEAAGSPIQSAVWLTEKIPPGGSYTYAYQVEVAPDTPVATHAFVHWLGPSQERVLTADVAP